MRAPTRGNRRLDQLLERVNGDDQVKAWWHVAAHRFYGYLSRIPVP